MVCGARLFELGQIHLVSAGIKGRFNGCFKQVGDVVLVEQRAHKVL